MSNKIDFINQIIAKGEVYALTLEDGYAMSLSNFFVNDDDEQIELFCFWSQKEFAKSCILNEWSDYKLSSVPLSVFLEDWCIGTSNENYGMGLDFDESLTGEEVDSLELLIEICKILKKEQVKIKYEKFKSTAQLLDYAEKAIQY